MSSWSADQVAREFVLEGFTSYSIPGEPIPERLVPQPETTKPTPLRNLQPQAPDPENVSVDKNGVPEALSADDLMRMDDNMSFMPMPRVNEAPIVEACGMSVRGCGYHQVV